MFKRLIYTTCFLGLAQVALSQLPEEPVEYTTKTFYSSRIVNSHTTENIDKTVLDFRINHRFGILSGGYETFFGLDNATMRMSFDYGITDDINVGIGRSTYEKNLDAFAKYRFLRQVEKNGNMPVSAVYVVGVSMSGLKPPPGRKNFFSSKLSYSHQLVVARKFSKTFSAQLMPILVHKNLIDSSHYQHDIIGIGIGLKQKIVPSVTLNLEYFYLPPDQISNEYQHPLSLGIDINTGWHTFQLHLTNATGTFEKAYLTQTTNRWSKGDIHFGFNISRHFHPAGFH